MEANSLDRRWTLARYALLGVGLVIAVLQYYLIDVYVEIQSMQRVQFFSPAASSLHHPSQRHSALQRPHLFC